MHLPAEFLFRELDKLNTNLIERDIKHLCSYYAEAIAFLGMFSDEHLFNAFCLFESIGPFAEELALFLSEFLKISNQYHVDDDHYKKYSFRTISYIAQQFAEAVNEFKNKEKKKQITYDILYRLPVDWWHAFSSFFTLIETLDLANFLNEKEISHWEKLPIKLSISHISEFIKYLPSNYWVCINNISFGNLLKSEEVLPLFKQTHFDYWDDLVDFLIVAEKDKKLEPSLSWASVMSALY